jgi:Tfp pilus assembly protein PilO
VTADWLTRWRERLLRPVLLLLAANALVFACYSLPRELQERSLAEHAAALRQEVERERRNLQRLRERADAIRANATDLERFYREVLKDQEQLLPVLKDLDKQAPSVGSRSYRQAEVKGAAVARYVVTMPLSGSYEQLMAFLQQLERSSHFLTIDRLGLRERDQGAQLDVEVSLYFRGAPVERKG